jgi:hypothetical protein
MLSTPSESYVPFFPTKEEVYKDPRRERTKSLRYKKHPPPLPAPRKTTTKTEALMVHRENVERSRGRQFVIMLVLNRSWQPPPLPGG